MRRLREAEKVHSPALYAIGPKEIVELAERDGVAIDVALSGRGRRRASACRSIVNATPYHHAQDTLDVRECKP